MQETYKIWHQAFSTALSQIDLSTFSPELQQEINQVSQALEDNLTQETIHQLMATVKKNEKLQQLYEAERLKLQEVFDEQQRNNPKGFLDEEDKPKNQDIDKISVFVVSLLIGAIASVLTYKLLHKPRH